MSADVARTTDAGGKGRDLAIVNRLTTLGAAEPTSTNDRVTAVRVTCKRGASGQIDRQFAIEAILAPRRAATT